VIENRNTLNIHNPSIYRSPPFPQRIFGILTIMAIVSTLSGCRKAAITSYQIPHEQSLTGSSPPTLGNDRPPTPSNLGSQIVTDEPVIQWDAPAEWTVQPDPSGIRKGSFSTKDSSGHEASISVTVFPGDVGGDFSNVNRWRGQLQLTPITESALESAISTTVLQAGVFKRVDLRSETSSGEPARIIGAWLKRDEHTWFFKMMGEPSLLELQLPSFNQFLASVHFSAAGGVTPSKAEALVVPPQSSADVVTGELAWSAPDSWQSKPNGAMRKASYSVHTQGDFSIIAFPGQAGGELANINRWRSQVQLPPLTQDQMASEVTKINNGNLNFTVVDFIGRSDAGPTRLLGAILPFGGQSYFFKLIGPDTVISEARPEFMVFIQSVTIH
jgi:hypothetical protein